VRLLQKFAVNSSFSLYSNTGQSARLTLNQTASPHFLARRRNWPEKWRLFLQSGKALFLAAPKRVRQKFARVKMERRGNESRQSTLWNRPRARPGSRFRQ